MNSAATASLGQDGDSQRDDLRDQAWVRSIVTGDSKAFECLYKCYYPRLFRFIERMTNNPELADELINETMMVVWDRPQHFDFTCKVSTWIFGIAYRKALKGSAKARIHDGHVSVDDLTDVLTDRAPTPSENAELEDLVTFAMNALPPDQRAVMELTYHQGLHYQEIAEILGCPENTVKTRVFHARKKLKTLLQDVRVQNET